MTLTSHGTAEMQLKGLAIAPGVAIGKFFFLPTADDVVTETKLKAADIALEVERYQFALDKAKEELTWLQMQLESEGVTEGGAILAAHRQMLSDSALNSNVVQQIKRNGKNAEYVLQVVVTEYRERFCRLADPFFRERFKDVQDVCRRILRLLRGTSHQPLLEIPPGVILCADELLTSHIVEATLSKVKGFVTRYGASCSHAAIVSKTKGLPLVSCIELPNGRIFDDALAIVDGNSGEIFINPTETTINVYRRRLVAKPHNQDSGSAFRPLTLETYDGYEVKLSANIETISELEFLHAHGGSGVGLFRSEYSFLSHEKFPSEEEQFALYREMVSSMRGFPIAIRTFDLGGDKYMACQDHQHENNPFLGCRAIRFLLREKELFKAQLRAILRASRYGKVSVMFPMVSSLPELLEAKELLCEARCEVEERYSVEVSPIDVGCMIEVPSAALTADHFAKECDFLSIGTNDLVQYTLAVDRGNNSLSELYTPAHPSVLRLIKHIATSAGYENIPVTICGEVAGDALFIPLLLGLGIGEFSVAPHHFSIVQQAIRRTSIVSACKLADRALCLSTSQEIQQLLAQHSSMPPFEIKG